MSLSGYPTIFGIDPYSIDTVPRHQVGVKGVASDGRVFRYSFAGASDIVTAVLCVAADITTNHEDIAFATAGSIGDTVHSITVGATAVAANEYVGGYMVIIDDTGEGYSHLITAHDASSAGSENINVYTKPGLQVATTTSTTVTLVRNPYRAVVIATGGTQTDVPVGVTPRAITASNYFWLQTGGIASILTSGTNTATAGEPITIGEATNGSVSGRDAVAEPFVGHALTGVAPTSGEHNPYFLELDF